MALLKIHLRFQRAALAFQATRLISVDVDELPESTLG